MARVLVALGSNLGDRAGYVREAIARLGALAVGPVRASSIYTTDPQDMEDDAEEFANAAAGFETALSARDLLNALLAIEEELGRPREHGYHESRTIDLDIVSYGGAHIDEEDLKVPHPRAHERRFVLLPLNEIAPDTELGGVKVRDHLRRLLAE